MEIKASIERTGLFLVDLRELNLSDKELDELNSAIEAAVLNVIAGRSDLESSIKLARLGPGIRGLVLEKG